jgi:excisionase family DNA binding protein
MTSQNKNTRPYDISRRTGAVMKDRVSYSPAECAQLLGICKNHIYKSFESGKLRSFKLGQRRLINREALDDFRLKLEQEHTAQMRGEGND